MQEQKRRIRLKILKIEFEYEEERPTIINLKKCVAFERGIIRKVIFHYDGKELRVIG